MRLLQRKHFITRTLVFFALLAGFGAITYSAFSAQTVKDSDDSRVTVRSLRYGTLLLKHHSPATAEDLGVPLYPGASVQRSFVYSARKHTTNEPVGYLAQAFLTTTDSPKEIIAFYKKELGESVGIESPAKCRETFLFRHDTAESLAVRIVCGTGSDPHSVEISRARLGDLANMPPPARRPSTRCCPQDNPSLADAWPKATEE